MIVLLVTASWISLLSLVAALCVAARTGDIQQISRSPITASRSPGAAGREDAADPRDAYVGSVRPDAALLPGDGVAA